MSEQITVETATGERLRAAQALRRAVFIFEQGVSPADEMDGRDDDALHLVAVISGRVVGTVRLFDEGARWRLTRMATDRRLRGAGVGRVLLERAHEVARGAGAAEMVLSAQLSAVGFYRRSGYSAHGEEYLDAGIPHVAMRRSLDDG